MASEFWGGLAAMLVALPSAIAFGVTIFSALDASYAAQGAVAGILGATVIGMIAPALGGTNRLISAPCAPAAAVLAAAAVQLAAQGHAPAMTLILLVLIGLVAGLAQILFGALRIGRLIKYMPYPVVSGYLSGVGLIIILSQVPKFLGAPQGTSFWQAVSSPQGWLWQGVAVGAVTVLVMSLAPKLTKAVPATILALAGALATYFALAVFDRTLLQVSGNPLVVGPLGGSGAGFLDATLARWKTASLLEAGMLAQVVVPALTLAVLLSIDTLKTCVVLDTLTRSRHEPNRELIGQGVANVASSLAGGIPGAGTMGATLINISSGAQTRLSGFIEGVLSLAAFLVLGSLIAWLPIAALAGILIVIGVRMIDWHSLQLLRKRSTVFDFVVIASVVAVAETVGLVAASGVGIALAILLFIREQVGGSVVRRKTYGNQMFSKQARLPAEMEVLERRGDRAAIVELQGSLFFGTTDQIYRSLEPELAVRSYIILDMRRVQGVDFTAAHMLQQVEDILAGRNGLLIFSHLPRSAPSGQDMQAYFDEVGVGKSQSRARTFDELDDALEWVEDRILEEERLERAQEKPLELREIDLFKSRKEKTLALLEALIDKRAFKAGEKIFARGDPGQELFLIRRGMVRIQLPLAGKSHHLTTFGRGDFFGEMSFLDREPRSADAVAFTDVDLYEISRDKFDAFVEGHKRVGMNLYESLARALAIRLRYANAELRVLEES